MDRPCWDSEVSRHHQQTLRESCSHLDPPAKICRARVIQCSERTSYLQFKIVNMFRAKHFEATTFKKQLHVVKYSVQVSIKDEWRVYNYKFSICWPKLLPSITVLLTTFITCPSDHKQLLQVEARKAKLHTFAVFWPFRPRLEVFVYSHWSALWKWSINQLEVEQ